MTLDDDELAELGFGNFWGASLEAVHHGASSSVVAARFHSDRRKAGHSQETKSKRTESRRRMKQIRRQRNQGFSFDGVRR